MPADTCQHIYLAFLFNYSTFSLLLLDGYTIEKVIGLLIILLGLVVASDKKEDEQI
jgi:hypothetical protein